VRIQVTHNYEHDCQDILHFTKVVPFTHEHWVHHRSVTRKHSCCRWYTCFGVHQRNHYILLQRFTSCHMTSHAKILHTWPFLHHVVPRQSWSTIPCPTLLDNIPEVKQISSKVVPYQSCDGTCFPGLSLHKSVLSRFEKELTTSHDGVRIVIAFKFTKNQPYHLVAQTLNLHIAKNAILLTFSWSSPLVKIKDATWLMIVYPKTQLPS
jgi:hypothetical protein